MPGQSDDSVTTSVRGAPSTMADEMEMLHPFFTHMGLPDPVGHVALRLSGVDAQSDGTTVGDFGFHLEAGLLPRFGLHVRNDRFVSNGHTELALQYALLQSADGMNGFSPFVELEIPTNREEPHTYGLVGFSTMWSLPRIEINQSVEYSPAESAIEGSLSAVLRAGHSFYPVVEFLFEAAKDVMSSNSGIAGLKYRLNEVAALGIAYQAPLTESRSYSHQFLIQADMEW